MSTSEKSPVFTGASEHNQNAAATWCQSKGGHKSGHTPTNDWSNATGVAPKGCEAISESSNPFQFILETFSLTNALAENGSSFLSRAPSFPPQNPQLFFRGAI